jgi:O-antigen ligase
VTSLRGALGHREHQGLIALVVVIVAGVLAAGAQLATSARVTDRPLRGGALVAHRGTIATVLVLAGLAVAIVVGAHESSGANQNLSGGASRLVSLRSNRFDYWHVALRAFALQPLHGVGAGNWQVYWLRWRTVQEFAADAHSLPLQTLAELGIVGVLALAAFLAGLLGAAARALRGAASSSAPVGAVAALVTYLAHAPLDWDWEMPAVTLVALVLAGLVISVADDTDVAPAP